MVEQFPLVLAAPYRICHWVHAIFTVYLGNRHKIINGSLFNGSWTCVQAMMTNSAFVMDWSRPVPLEEFFLPAADVTIPAYRACVETPELKSRRFRITRQPNATANVKRFSSASPLTLLCPQANRKLVADISICMNPAKPTCCAAL